MAQYPLYFGSRNGGDGEGLFAGIGRYEMLMKKLRDAATFNMRLSGLYQSLTELLCLSNYYPESQLIFSTLPYPIQSAVSVACLKNPQFITALARQIAECVKTDKKNKTEDGQPYKPTIEQVESLIQERSDAVIMAIPDLSGNSLGYQLRCSATLALMELLGIEPKHIPTGARYFLFHGGQKAKSVSAPSDADLVEAKLRALYPSVDAFSGCTDAFFMGKSRLNLQSHILCRENNRITEALAGLSNSQSVFEMLDIVTMTRVGDTNTRDDGQMIFSMETICKGTEALLKLSFEPYTRLETVGAVIAGLQYWMQRDGEFGGKSARGFGRFAMQALSDLPKDALEAYTAHVDSHRTEMIQGLMDGTFGTGKVICKAGLDDVVSEGVLL